MDAPTSPAALQNASAAYERGNLAEAGRFCKEILTAYPEHFETLVLLSAIQLRSGQLLNALATYDKILNIRPDAISILNNRGNLLATLNRVEEALASYETALAIKPDFVEALFNQGNTFKSLKRLDAALASYDKALAIRPDFAEALDNRGNTLHELKRFDEALASYDRALTVRPDYVAALNNRGNILLQLGRYDEALTSYDRALVVRPNYVDALNNRGNILLKLTRFHEALASYDRALAVRPDHVEALNNRGNALQELKRFEEALNSYNRAIALRPDYTLALNNKGNTLHELNRLDEALASYERVLAIHPDYVDALYNRGNTLQKLKRFEEALTSYDRAISLQNDHTYALNNRGNALQELKRLDEALTSYDCALAVDPHYAHALSNRGNVLQELKRFDEALVSYSRAIAAQPDFAQAHFNRASCWLLTGDLNRGWVEYEWRCFLEEAKADMRTFAHPLWRGDLAIKDRTIFIYSEQGFGDTIQFCRFAKLVAKSGQRVILEVQPELKSLLTALDGVCVIARGEKIPEFDCYSQLASLPLAFKTTLADIPDRIPYLSAPKEKANVWRNRFGEHTKPRIGLVWAGSPRKELPKANRIDRQRSIDFDRLAPLFQGANCEFYSLQKGDDAVAQLHQSNLRHRVVDWADVLRDFADTAALIENLDLVISVDTAVAHLAGALGKPFWLMNRYNTCWRWLLDREDSPWYPTARIFRQTTWGDWDSVINQIASELQHWTVAQDS
jgi:tetratricopeptide (TPR) repeat protein